MTTEQRFDRFVERTDGCWAWKGTKDPQGYGHFWDQGAMRRAHRVAYRLWRGELTPGLVIDHLCRNASCVRPEHMELVSVRLNTLRGTSGSARNAVKTACSQGHAFTFENTLRFQQHGRWKRKCRACTRRRDQLRRGGDRG